MCVPLSAAPPEAIPKDYYGLFSTLADVLSRHGIVTLRFDNRAYTDKTLSPREETVTMFDQADDIHQAWQSLRKDKRFTRHSIGLLGHSEGGAAVAIEASRNKDISFAVYLSTCGIRGREFAYEQTAMPIEFNKRMPEDAKQLLLSSLKRYLCVVDAYDSVDSIKAHLRQEVESFYNASQNKSKIWGRSSLEDICRTTIWGYTRPRLMAFIKYNPEQYYSALSCPLLIMCGKMDGTQDYKRNIFPQSECAKT